MILQILKQITDVVNPNIDPTGSGNPLGMKTSVSNKYLQKRENEVPFDTLL